jgi:hypothetical protein
MSRRLTAALFCLLPCLNTVAAAPASPYRDVEACFVIDTTGSMSELIQAAKEKVWFIANEIVNAPSRPRVRLCLMAYRDRGDEYVTRRTDLTADIDAIYKELQSFEAGGGGDTPEAVNQALLETVEKTRWSKGDDTLRLIFVVGDAPPSVYPDEPQYPEVVARATARGIVINPVQCGADGETRKAFDAIAAAGGGEIAVLADPGRVERVVTPMDQDLAALNVRLGSLIIPYGDAATRAAVDEKQDTAEAMDDVGVSERLAFNTATGRVVQGGGDLIDAIAAGDVTPGAIDRDRLPEGLRSMSEAELAAHVAAIRTRRDGLQRVIRNLIAERKSYLDAHAGTRGGFDRLVADLVQRQLATPPTRPGT